jgi:hypothetical protein
MFHHLFADVLAGLRLLTCGGWAVPAVSHTTARRDNRSAQAV